MDNFLRFDDACTLYNHIMTKWFEIFPGATERVHYVKYQDLVQNFEAEMIRALGFLGLDWHDAVRDFAALSEKRNTRTPSYAKVRSGLAAGVQSSWRNYGFLFETPAAQPLRQWVDRFGYERTP